MKLGPGGRTRHSPAFRAVSRAEGMSEQANVADALIRQGAGEPRNLLIHLKFLDETS